MIVPATVYLFHILHTVQVWTFAQNLHPVQILFPVQKI